MGLVLSKSELAQTEPAERAAFEASFRSSMRGIGVVFRSLLTASEIQDLRPHEVCGGALRVFKLADEHPLTKAGLRCVHVVEKAELGLRPGDIVFEFPFGRIVDTGMACRRDGIIPPEIDIMTIHKEANATRAGCNQQAQEEERINVSLFRPAV